ncbi:MAG: hypothetical protein ACLP1Y_02160 [Candidatus Acidiferrales bacterium]
MASGTVPQAARPGAPSLRWPIFALILSVCCGFAIAAQSPQTEIARISGDDIDVKGAASVEVIEGRSTTVLNSGSGITVRSGIALITLASGGEIAICGPAHFTLLQSGGTTTVALDYGRVHPRLDAAENFAIYTPQVVATPIAVGGGARDLSVGLTQSGTMCVLAAQGAVRVELQLTGQSMIVPQGGEMTLEGGQLQAGGSGGQACSCESPQARAPRESPMLPPLELSVPARPSGNATTENAPPAVNDEPIYKVYMPPLTFSASSPQPPPDPSPELILLVRRARVRQAAYFTGVVEAAPAPQAAAPAPSRPQAAPQPAAAPPRPSLYQRIKNYFHRWTGGS